MKIEVFVRFRLLLFLFGLTCSPAGALEKADSVVTAEDLVALRDIGGRNAGAINVSPDGQWVVLELQSPTTDGDDYELTWIGLSLKKQESRPFRIADGGDVLLNPSLASAVIGDFPQKRAKWSPDSSSFIYLVRRGGQTQLWRSRPDRKGQEQITHSAGDVIDFSWSADGSKIFFTTGLDRSKLQESIDAESARGFLYDDRFLPRVSKLPIQRNCEDAFAKGAAYDLARPCNPQLWVYELRTKSERLATDHERDLFEGLNEELVVPEQIEERTIRGLRRSPDGSRFAWLQNTNPVTYRGPYAPQTIFALIDGEVIKCSEESCRAYANRGHQGMWWRDKKRELIFLRRDGFAESEISLYAWSPESGDIRKIRQSEDWLSDCATAEDRLICLNETWTQPRKVVSVSLEDGQITTLYDPNPEFARHRFGKIEKLQWEDEFGLPTVGHLAYPINYVPGRTFPLVIVTYQSRGFLRGGVGDEYPIHPLAAEGFFVLSQEMPFDTELAAREADYNAKLLENQYLRRSVLSSQEVTIQKLARAGLIDDHRVAITGLSEGAVQTAYAVMNSKTHFAAAITSGLWESPSSYYLMNQKARKWWRDQMVGGPDDPASAMNWLSIGLNVDRVNTPLLVNVSEDEFLGSVENVVRLKEAGKPAEMYVFPGEHHIKWRPKHRLSVYRRNIQWVKFWLKGEEEDDPVSPGQYERWREMRDQQCAEEWSEREKPSYCDYAGAVH